MLFLLAVWGSTQKECEQICNQRSECQAYEYSRLKGLKRSRCEIQPRYHRDAAEMQPSIAEFVINL